LKRGDKGVNKLDDACKEHDVSYSQTTDLTERHKADKILADKAWQRVKASDSTFGERLSALGVTGAMKAKVKLGMGMKKKRKVTKKGKGYGPKLVKRNKRARSISIPSSMKMHTGGFLPLIFAGLSALGALAGGAATMATSINRNKAANKTLEELKRHNAAMEVKMGSGGGRPGRGRGRRRRRGQGIYVRPYSYYTSALGKP